MTDIPSTAIRAHRFRLEPTQSQAKKLAQAAGARRYVYNWGLATWRSYYAAARTSPPRGFLSAEITQLKHSGELAWLCDLPSQIPQQALFDLERSFKAFFAGRSGYPRFRSKKASKASFRIPQHVKLDADRVYIPKVGWIRARVSREVGKDLGSATVSRAADGRWFVSINERFVPPPRRLVDPEAVIGLDVGLIDLVVGSNGLRVPAPRFARKSALKVRRAHRRYSRTQPGSRRHERARRALARTHAHTGDQRKDFLHKLTTQITSEHDAFVLEDVALHALARTKLGKSFGDAALAELARQLHYKARWNGKETVIVDRFFPSTRRCSCCGTLAPPLGLSHRYWRCTDCGTSHDRDLNAALNLRDEGLRLLRDRGAHGHAQSPSSPGQTFTEGTRRRSGNRDLERMSNRFDSGPGGTAEA